MKKTRRPARPISWSRLRALKAADRRRGADRLVRGEVTRELLQQENAVIQNAHLFRIADDSHAIRYFRQQLRLAKPHS